MRKKYHQFVSAISKDISMGSFEWDWLHKQLHFNVKAASPKPFPGKVALVKALDVMMNKRAQSKKTPPV